MTVSAARSARRILVLIALNIGNQLRSTEGRSARYSTRWQRSYRWSSAAAAPLPQCSGPAPQRYVAACWQPSSERQGKLVTYLAPASRTFFGLLPRSKG